MDSNPKSATAIDAIDSSSSSLTSSFAQLEIIPHNNNNNNNTGGGPINRLPNELMQLIVAKLGLDGDLNKLIRLRLVSTRWRAVIEDYCAMKKSLIVAPIAELAYYNYKTVVILVLYDDYLTGFEKRFFGYAKLNDFARLHLTTEMPSECLKSLLKLFPNVVRLSIYCEDQLRVSDLFQYIKSLDALKQLDLNDEIAKALPHLSQTLFKLEHIAFTGNEDILNEDEFCQCISHLGPDCVRFYFRGSQFNCEHILQWHKLNPTWLSNLTHLGILFNGTREWNSKVVNHLIEHTTSLTHFKANFHYNSFDLSPTVIRNFGKLAHLVELELWHIGINISEWKQAVLSQELNSQSSLLNCKLYYTISRQDDYLINGHLFVRLLSAAFPNLAELNVAVDMDFEYFDYFQDEIQHNLHRFPNLHKHDIYEH